MADERAKSVVIGIFMNYKLQKLFLTILFLFSIFYFLFSISVLAQAARIDLWEGVSPCCHPDCGDPEYTQCEKKDCGNCQLIDVLKFVRNIGKLILQFLGVAALIAFIYGGLLWITSGGQQDKIKKGKAVLSGAVIGILIVVFAYVIVVNIMEWLGVEKKEYYPKAEKRSCQDYGPGYACRNESDCKETTIIRGLCPGPKEIVCCEKK